MSESERKFYIRTLGCPRNDADSEAIINILTNSGYSLTGSVQEASLIIINTCAFIKDAISESIDNILQLSTINRRARILVSGCLPQRYKRKLKELIPEIDLMTGTGSIKNIMDALKSEKSYIDSNIGFIGRNIFQKCYTTPNHYRYLKIQEGCDYNCSYCVIPDLKGKSHSKELELIKKEVSEIPEDVRELILIGQNTSSWEHDSHGKYSLDLLIKEIAPVFPHWIRILYLHPLSINKDLLDTINIHQNVINYLDIPLQHVSTSVLKSMNRGYDRCFIEELMKMIENSGDFNLRTTFIVGYPDESQSDFEDLCEFVDNSNISRMGIFKYSREEGTKAYRMKQLEENTINNRYNILHSIILKRFISINEELIGNTIDVLIDGEESGEFYGRTRMDAPDIDGIVWVNSKNGIIHPGNFYRVKITDSYNTELFGELH